MAGVLTPSPATSTDRASRSSRRQQVIDLLGRLGVPASLRSLSELAGLWSGVPLTVSGIAALLRTDASRYQQDPAGAASWLVPALDAATLTAINTLVVCSTWPAERRLIGSRTLRLLHLSTLLALLDGCDASDRTERLDALTRSYAESVKGATAPGQRLDREQVHATADAELHDLAALDAQERQAASVRLLRLPPAQQLWGLPVVLTGVRG